MVYTTDMEGREITEEATTVVELERETVRELRLMLKMYTWNTIATVFGAAAGWIALAVVILVLLMK
jgi:hypothetical protein